MKSVFTVLILLFLANSSFSQTYYIRGDIVENESNLPLSFAAVRVAGSSMGTTANKDGRYEIKLPAGNYKLIVSFIGYISDTIAVKLNKDMPGVNFNLSKTNLDLPEIVIRPGENPALEIIRKAIARKMERDGKINSYRFEAYTKGLIKTQDELNAGSNTVTMGTADNDSIPLKITGIIENQSMGYFKRPNNYKEIITARKQTANFPPSVNVLSGGRLVKNFYEDDINFLGKELPGPLAQNALRYYYFYIQKTVAMDNQKVYQIHMEPDVSSDPGFVGSIFITDSAYDLIKIDLQLNRAANTGGVFDTVNIFQQFSSYDDFYMPADYRLVVNANILGLLKFGFELNTILYDYKMNSPIEDSFFDKAILKVTSEADDKDSVYWLTAQTIPSTTEEQSAYKRIDSISSVPKTFWDKFSFLSSRIYWSNNFSTSAPLGMYHFNRVEGHTLDFGLYVDDALKNRLNSSLSFSYGFSDEKLKKDLDVSFLFGEYRTTRLSLNAFDRIDILFGKPEFRKDFTATVLSLVSKYEFQDYYYSNGFNLIIASEVFPVVELNAGFINRTDNSAVVNTDFSFFAKKKTFKSNPPVNEVRINALTAGFKLDFRNYIEDGLYRRRISQGKSFIIFEGGITYSNNSLLKSSVDFTKYELKANGILNTFKSANLSFRVFSQYNEGTLPYQMLYAVPGSIDYIAENFSFRTLEPNEITGSNVVTVNIEHYWRDELFRFFRIPLLKNLELQLTTYLNIAYSDVNYKTRSFSIRPIETFKAPFYEAGFMIGHVLFPIQIDFTWKLNHRGKNDFRIGINSFVF